MIFSSRRFAKVSVLLQTASFLAIGNVLNAQAQTAATQQPPEQVLVTGSLIHGAATVGVPVTNLSDQDFKETGSLTVADVLKELPAVSVQVSNAINESGGQLIHNQDVVIHNVTSGNASESLLMIDGIRFPPQGLGFCVVDPSIIPTLALERVDILADGASATYGSDALAGVVNAVLRRGFDGAITQVQYGQSTDIGGASVDAQQLYGRKWDSGDVTVSYEYYHIEAIHGPGRSYFTTNFVPFGYDNRDPIGVSMPGVVSTGSLKTDPTLAAQGFSAKAGNLACTNCFSIPTGTGWNFGSQAPGPTISWAALQTHPGVLNEHNSAQYADILPSQERNAGSLVFDQNIFAGVSLFVEGFYSERRSIELYTPGASPASQLALSAVPVPTINPYYPTGAPSNLRVSYDLGVDADTVVNSGETAGRYAAGFNLDLPFNWFGKLYYSTSIDNSYGNSTNMVNSNMVTAALGGTVTVPAGSISPNDSAYTFTKPANVPYLNLFCDASVFTCNSPATLAYIHAYRDYTVRWKIGEFGANFDGPLFSLPGGDVKAAIGANRYSNTTLFQENFNFSTPSTAIPSLLYDPESYNDWAVYGQLDIPIVGPNNQLPLVEALSLEAAYRYDSYNLFGSIAVPKVAGSWTVADGFTLRANWGKGFRAPNPAEVSPVNGALDQPLNLAGGDTQDDIVFNCSPVRNLPGGKANPGTLQAILNPTCSANEALAAPGGITISGGSGIASAVRSGTGISPEKSDSWNLGFNFTPTDPFLKGISVDVVWYNLRINGVISTNGSGLASGNAGPNDPLGNVCTAPGNNCQWYVRANPNLPITDPSNAAFFAMVQSLINNPKSVVPVANLTNIEFIQDNASENQGFKSISGIDFNGRYDFDLGELGAWNAGLTGNYQLTSVTQAEAGGPILSDFIGQSSGGRLHYRARLGWADTTGDLQGLSVTGFLNFIPHSPSPSSSISGGGNIPSACFWQTGATMPCYAGAPTYGPFANYPGATPGMYTWDMSFGYNTGTRPANLYLQNVNLQLTVLNVLNKAPAFQYNISSGRAVAAQIANQFGISPLQRFINIAITKSW
ncbi:MAG: TonB-dependent receptor [Alphaproteobacteria bacterium]|nr:TonB-dependent receptor [Alphaproteobacteria bacterium]